MPEVEYEPVEGGRFVACDHCEEAAMVKYESVPDELKPMVKKKPKSNYLVFKFSGKCCCTDCLLELAFGRIPPASYSNKSPGGNIGADHDGEPSPSFHDVVRFLEEDR